MSVDNVMAFWKKLNDDSGLQARLQAKVKPLEGWDAVVSFASEAGFDFTTDDYEAAVNALPREVGAAGWEAAQRGEKLAEELSDDDLDAVVGGVAMMAMGDLSRKLAQPGNVLSFRSPVRGILKPFGSGPIA